MLSFDEFNFLKFEYRLKAQIQIRCLQYKTAEDIRDSIE